MSEAPPRLRVLMIVQRVLPYLAGAELQALGLAGQLLGLGHEVEVAATRYAPGLRPREAVRGVPVRRLPALRGAGLKPSQLVASLVWTAAHARRFDLVHAHCVSPASLGAVLGARSAGIPVLLKPSLGGAGGELDAIRRSGLATPIAAVLRRVDRFAVLTEDIGRELTALGIPAHRLIAVHNGVNLATFRPPEPGERQVLRERLRLPNGPVVLFAGQLVARKGVGALLEAWRSLAPRLVDPLLLIAGDGAERPRIQRWAADPAARVRIMGHVHEIAEIMRASDVFALPSSNESFGNAVVEAMASGLPVVVCRTGIAAKLDIDPGAGRVLDAPEPGAIARALDDILNASDRAALGARGRVLVEPFAQARTAARYVDVYRSLLDRCAVLQRR